MIGINQLSGAANLAAFYMVAFYSLRAWETAADSTSHLFGTRTLRRASEHHRDAFNRGVSKRTAFKPTRHVISADQSLFMTASITLNVSSVVRRITAAPGVCDLAGDKQTFAVR